MDIIKNSGKEKIYYEYYQSNHSNAPTLILVHGLGLSSRSWKYIIPLLSEYNILIFDLRGHGQSEKSFSSISWKIFIDDLYFLLNCLKIEEFHYIAHGIGVQLGIEMLYQAKEPIKCKSLTFLSTPTYYPIELIKSAIDYRKREVLKNYDGNIGLCVYKELLYLHDKEKINTLIEMYDHVNFEDYFALLELNALSLSIEKLTSIQIPVLILSGEFDAGYPMSLVTLSSNYIKKVTTQVITDSSNMVHFDQPIQVAHSIRSFINQIIYPKAKGHLHILPYVEDLKRYLVQQSISEKSTLKVEIIGKFHVSYKDTTIKGKWPHRKANEIITYLSIHGRCSKEQLCTILWEDQLEGTAKSKLRVSIHHLKNILKSYELETILSVNRQDVSLNCEYECDLITVEQQLHSLINSSQWDTKIFIADQIVKGKYYNANLAFTSEWIIELQQSIEYLKSLLLEQIYDYFKTNENTSEAEKYYRYLQYYTESFLY